jgi:hypothetical protein
MDQDMGYGHASWTWTYSMDIARTCSIDMDDMDMNSLRGFGRAAWIRTMDIHGCRNADKKLSLILLFYNS